MTGWLKPISGFPQKQQQQPLAPLIQLYVPKITLGLFWSWRTFEIKCSDVLWPFGIFYCT
jgi:hypothetical protein